MTNYESNQRIERKSVSQLAAEQIIKFIKASRYACGEKIPAEKELMDMMQVGRSTVREALHTLVAMGILQSKSGKGYFLQGNPSLLSFPRGSEIARLMMKDEDFFALLEVREVLEKRIAELAIRRATNMDLQKIKEIINRIKHAGEKNGNISEVTVELHRALAESTHNHILVELMDKIVPLIVFKAKAVALSAEEELRMHVGVEDYLSRGDERAMVNWVEEHLAYMKRKYLESVKNE
jgi:GntR family transcriptional regulator, transcriptional repressor for pyruvate dehydrogenase complex